MRRCRRTPRRPTRCSWRSSSRCVPRCPSSSSRSTTPRVCSPPPPLSVCDPSDGLRRAPAAPDAPPEQPARGGRARQQRPCRPPAARVRCRRWQRAGRLERGRVEALPRRPTDRVGCLGRVVCRPPLRLSRVAGALPERHGRRTTRRRAAGRGGRRRRRRRPRRERRCAPDCGAALVCREARRSGVRAAAARCGAADAPPARARAARAAPAEQHSVRGLTRIELGPWNSRAEAPRLRLAC